MKDTTLLDRSEPLTMNQLRRYFLAHDFSAQASGYSFKNAPSEKNQIYLKAKGIFRTFWEQQMKKLCKKGSLRNFSKDAPIRCLAESEENLVAGTVMEILGNEPHVEKLMDQVLTSMQKSMNAEIAAALGYTNHSPVTKRLQRLKKQFHIFMAQRNET